MREGEGEGEGRDEGEERKRHILVNEEFLKD